MAEYWVALFLDSFACSNVHPNISEWELRKRRSEDGRIAWPNIALIDEGELVAARRGGFILKN